MRIYMNWVFSTRKEHFDPKEIFIIEQKLLESIHNSKVSKNQSRKTKFRNRSVLKQSVFDLNMSKLNCHTVCNPNKLTK